MLKTIQYPISASYCADWGQYEACREFIANALDADPDPAVTHRGGVLTIADRGTGFDPRHLMFGEGGEVDSGNIRIFHEGAKLGLLVLAREGLPVTVDAPGFRIQSATMEDFGLGAEGLSLKVEVRDAPGAAGTTVTVRNVDPAAVERAVGGFDGLRYNGRRRRQIEGGCAPRAGGRGRVFVNRVLCHQSDDLLYDYSFDGSDARYGGLKGGMNRDRSEIASHHLREAVANHWRSRDPRELAAALPRFKGGSVEYAAMERYGARHDERVLAALQIILNAEDDWRERHVVHTDRDASTICERHGLRVYRPGSRRNTVSMLLGVLLPSDVDTAARLTALGRRRAKERVQKSGRDRVAIQDTVFVPWRLLDDAERIVLERAAGLLHRSVMFRHGGPADAPPAVNVLATSAWRMAPVCCFESSSTNSAGCVIRSADATPEAVGPLWPGSMRGRSGGVVIGIRRDQLRPGGEAGVAAILAHELAHVKSNAQDGTVEFETALTDAVEALAGLIAANPDGGLDEYEAADGREWTTGQIRRAAREHSRAGNSAAELLHGFGDGDRHDGDLWRYLGHYYIQKRHMAASAVTKAFLFAGRDGGRLRRLVSVVDRTSRTGCRTACGILGPRSGLPWLGAIMRMTQRPRLLSTVDGIFTGWREVPLEEALPELAGAPAEEWSAACAAGGTEGTAHG